MFTKLMEMYRKYKEIILYVFFGGLATVVSIELNMGVIISVAPATQARRNVYPRSRYCEIFSVTIMELSIIIPTARIIPESDMTLSEILNM